MRDTIRELRYAGRALRRNPGFTATALLTLAIGIGANTAVFSVVYNVLLKPLSYRDSEKLAVILDRGVNPVSPSDYLDYKAQTTAFDSIEAAQVSSQTLDSGGRAELVPCLQVTSGLLTMLGVAPERGRLFLPSEDSPTAHRVVVISHALWQRALAGEANVIGSTLRLNAHQYTVVGVMPPGFQFAPFWATDAQMWIPLDLSNRVKDRAGRSLRVFARLKTAASLEQARTQMSTIARRLETLYPETNTGIGAEVVPLLEKVTGPVRPTLLVLLATVGFVLLIACANVANLLLTRAIGRRREIAVRLAIGAGRWRLMREIAVESLVVAGGGAVLGLLLASGSLKLLARLLPPSSLPRLGEVTIGPMVLAFAIAAALLTALATALLPALQSSNMNLVEGLQQGSRGSAGGSQTRARSVLIACEVALALVLLVCAGLTIRTLAELTGVDPGFNPRRLLTMYVFAPVGDTTGTARRVFFDGVKQSLAATPGVQAVSAINHLPIGGDVWTFEYQVAGRPAAAPGHKPSAVYRVVRPAYFETMQIRLLRGREFAERDNAQSAPVVIISERLAREQWPGGDPVGQTLQMRVPSAPKSDETRDRGLFTIVGVVGNARQSDWTSVPEAEFYLPYAQHADAWDQSAEAFVIRTGVDPASLMATVENRVRVVDPHVVISELRPMDKIIGDKLWRSRLSAALLGAFGAIALVLAAIGIYGVVSYSVRQRRREIGIRMALGAARADVLWLSFRQSMGPVFAGLVMGMALAFAVAPWLASLLYGVAPTDPATFLGVAVALIVVSSAATVFPIWRAAAANVVTVLRDE